MTESDRKKVHKTDEDENDKGLKDLEAKHIKNKWHNAFFQKYYTIRGGKLFLMK